MTLSYRKSTSVVIDDEDALPMDFKKVSYDVTHWMPLPPLPITNSKEAEA